jgi:hypothetical protein
MTGWLAACTVTPAEAPLGSGPSELALSLGVNASPEVLIQDGTSRSIVTVTARDAAARPTGGIAARADILVDGVPREFGRLSMRELTTGLDGRASVVYTAPPPVDGVATETIVTVAITPSTGDARSHVPRTVDIKLVPQIGAPFVTSSFRTRHSVPSEPGIPHSAHRTPSSFRAPHSAFRIE